MSDLSRLPLLLTLVEAVVADAVLSLPNVQRRATNSWATIRDTFFSTKVSPALPRSNQIKFLKLQPVSCLFLFTCYSCSVGPQLESGTKEV